MPAQRTTIVTGYTSPASDQGHDYPYQQISPSIQAQRSLEGQDDPQHSMQYDNQDTVSSSPPAHFINGTPPPGEFQNLATSSRKNDISMAEDDWVEAALEDELIELDNGPPTTRRRIASGEVSKTHHMENLNLTVSRCEQSRRLGSYPGTRCWSGTTTRFM
jgi:hypothetical protein